MVFGGYTTLNICRHPAKVTILHWNEKALATPHGVCTVYSNKQMKNTKSVDSQSAAVIVEVLGYIY